MKAVSVAVACAYKMGAHQRYPREKSKAFELIDSALARLGKSSEDNAMRSALESCVYVLERLEFEVTENE